MRKYGNKRKKERNNLHDDGKEQFRKLEKKGKKFMRDKLNDDEEEKVRTDDNERKKENVVALIIKKKNS